MKLNFKVRDWHGWLSVILLVPLLLVGLSALFIAHNKTLGLKEIDVGAVAGWLPGYGATPAAAPADVRSALTQADGTRWLGTRNGIFELRPDADPLQHLAGHEVRGLVSSPAGLIAASKNGLWLREGESGPSAEWQRVLGGEFWSLSRDADGTLNASGRDKGIARSADGKYWEWTAPPALPLTAAQEKLTLGKLMLDLHTGKAFFGKDGEWIWIDLLATVWAFLGGTGLYLWWRTQTKRRDAALSRSTPPPAPATTGENA